MIPMLSRWSCMKDNKEKIYYCLEVTLLSEIEGHLNESKELSKFRN